MSILQYPEGTTKNSTQLHVWNNAAFDGKEESQDLSFPLKTYSWSSDCSKENLSPAALDSSPVSAIKHNFGTSGILGNSRSQSILKLKKKKGSEQEDEKRIDDEIEEIENEIKRLTSRLEALRLEKAAAAKTVEKKGRIIAAKFMEPPKQAFVKKIEETPKAKINNMRRGVSLGPAEIASRGGGGGRSSRKADIVTPVPATQSRRKSCFWKLEEIDEGKGKGKGVSERRKSLSLSPKSGKLMGRVNLIPGQRQAVTTTANLGSRKCVKKEEEVLALVQPRKLFKEGGKSVPNSKNKMLKPGRVVASRYNQIANQSSGNSVAVDARKRLLPENDNDDYGGGRYSSVRVKKRWEIPAEVVVYKSEDKEEEEPLLLSSSSIADMSDVWLPKIRTLRSAHESPRDSGAAKRVAELEGKRSYFCPDKDVEASVCQVLSFAEDAIEEE